MNCKKACIVDKCIHITNVTRKLKEQCSIKENELITNVNKIGHTNWLVSLVNY